MVKKQMGLLVMAYGTPYQEEDIERYYTHIRRGRRPTSDMVEELRRRYEAIGGISPLATITLEQAVALEKRLNEVQRDIEFKMYLGLKHIEPFIEDAVKKMYEDGIEKAISIVLAPHFSNFSVKSYNHRAKEAAARLGGPSIELVKSWYKEPNFIQYWVNSIRNVLEGMPEDELEQAAVIFSAHSLPEKILQTLDPYPEQLRETADLIGQRLGLNHYYLGWQSAGNTPESWLGPDVQDLTRQLYEEHKFKAFVYAPVGFVSDHLEVLYDNDFECKAVTNELGVSYYRPEMPNSHPLFIDALTTVVLNRLSNG